MRPQLATVTYSIDVVEAAGGRAVLEIDGHPNPYTIAQGATLELEIPIALETPGTIEKGGDEDMKITIETKGRRISFEPPPGWSQGLLSRIAEQLEREDDVEVEDKNPLLYRVEERNGVDPQKIQAIKHVRKMTGWSLAAAKEWVDGEVHSPLDLSSADMEKLVSALYSRGYHIYEVEE